MGKMKEFLKIYGEIGPLLMKLESLVLQTSTGSSELMSYYYNTWEKKVFNSLIRYGISVEYKDFVVICEFL